MVVICILLNVLERRAVPYWTQLVLQTWIIIVNYTIRGMQLFARLLLREWCRSAYPSVRNENALYKIYSNWSHETWYTDRMMSPYLPHQF